MSNNSWEKLLGLLSGVERVIATLAFALMVVIAFADVLMREVSGQGLDGAREAAVLLMIVLVMTGFGLATAAGRQLRPRFADPLVPESWQPAVSRGGDLLATGIFILLALLGAILVAESINLAEVTPVLRVPSWIIQIVLPLAFAVNAVRHLVFFVRPSLKPTDDISALASREQKSP